MNYAIFKQWTLDRVEDLVSFGVPRDEAERLVISMEVGAIAAEAAERNDTQFLLDLKEAGTTALADRKRCSPEAIRAKRRKIIRKRTARHRLREPA
jgi:hypothetical protein